MNEVSRPAAIGRRDFLKGAAAVAAFSTTGLAGWLKSNPALANPAVAVIAMPNTPPRADSAFADQFVESELLVNTYDRLFEYKTKRREDGLWIMDGAGYDPVEAMLAESWTVSDDKKVITIALRKGVKSSFGNEMTTEDVRWSLERNIALGANGPFYLGAIGFPDMSGFEVVDKYNFKMTLKEPNVLFFKVLALPLVSIVDSVEGKKHTKSDDPWAAVWFKTNTAGFGAYTVSQWSPGEQVVVDVNPNYWAGAPAIKRIVFREVPDSANRLALLQNGDVDLAWALNARERATAKGDAAIKIYSVEPGQQSSWLAMTCNIKPFDDVRVRQAVCYAVPYDELVSTVTLGTGRRQLSPLPAPYEFYDGSLDTYVTNIDKAKALLSEAGLPAGFQTTLGFSTAAPEDEQTAVILKSGLAKAGIDVTLDKQPLAAFVEKWLGGKYPMTTQYAGAFVPDAAYALRLWFYSRNNVLAFTRWVDEDINDKIDALKTTFDQDKRRELAVAVQKGILEAAPMAFLIEPGIHYAVRASLTDLQYFTDSATRYFRTKKSA
jgi:peptide/nickel transport system substrate-binding protein